MNKSLEEILSEFRKTIIDEVGSEGFDYEYIEYLTYYDANICELANYYDRQGNLRYYEVVEDYFKYLTITGWYIDNH